MQPRARAAHQSGWSDSGKRYLIGVIEAAGQTYNEVVAVKGDLESQLQSWMGVAGSGSRAQEFLDVPKPV